MMPSFKNTIGREDLVGYAAVFRSQWFKCLRSDQILLLRNSFCKIMWLQHNTREFEDENEDENEDDFVNGTWTLKQPVLPEQFLSHLPCASQVWAYVVSYITNTPEAVYSGCGDLACFTN
jgi:hypothetical protein